MIPPKNLVFIENAKLFIIQAELASIMSNNNDYIKIPDGDPTKPNMEYPDAPESI